MTPEQNDMTLIFDSTDRTFVILVVMYSLNHWVIVTRIVRVSRLKRVYIFVLHGVLTQQQRTPLPTIWFSPGEARIFSAVKFDFNIYHNSHESESRIIHASKMETSPLWQPSIWSKLWFVLVWHFSYYKLFLKTNFVNGNATIITLLKCMLSNWK